MIVNIVDFKVYKKGSNGIILVKEKILGGFNSILTSYLESLLYLSRHGVKVKQSIYADSDAVLGIKQIIQTDLDL